MRTLDEFARHKQGEIGVQKLLRRLRHVPAGLLNFCSNDYLALSQDGRLIEAACMAGQRYGTGAGASRLVTGNHLLYEQLESTIAALKGTEAALVFGSGYLANIGVIPALVGERDLILADELSHACMMSGAKLSGARVLVFKHNDVAHLSSLLAKHRSTAEHCLVMTEGVFSMDGDMAPLAALDRVTKEFGGWLLTDDAHGLGVVGSGRGSAAHWHVKPDLQMGTLSKSVGSYGGYVATSQVVNEFLINRSRSLIYATGLPPAVVAASISGLQIIAQDLELCALPMRNAKLFSSLLGLQEPQSAIVPLIVGAADLALAASELLEREGYVVTAIRPPTVPNGTARLRFTFTAQHARHDIERLAGTVKRLVLPMMAPEK